MRKKSRLVDIDNAKGLAISLVVLGHIVATDMPQDNEWYAQVKFGIYNFHMPFFMFISGLIMAFNYPRIEDIHHYLNYVWARVKRLMPGFMIFGVLIYFGKISASYFMHVDDIPHDIFSEIYKLMIIPANSAGGSLWFIYVLMEMYVIFPILISGLKCNSVSLIIIGAILHFIPAPDYLMLNKITEYFVFFGMGFFIMKNYERYLLIIDTYFFGFFAAFLTSFLLLTHIPGSESKMLIGLLSLPALHGLVRRAVFSNISALRLYGNYTYSIYLMNTIMIGLIKGIILKFTTWDGSHFLWIAPCLLFAGIYGPIIIKKYILVKLPMLDRITTRQLFLFADYSLAFKNCLLQKLSLSYICNNFFTSPQGNESIPIE